MSELCLKDQTVLTLKDIEGVPSEIEKIVAQELLPVCLLKECTMEKLTEWLNSRNIPEKREGMEYVKSNFGDSWLVNKNYASLSDHYWIKKRTETWSKINFFNNLYSQDIGDMFFRPWTVNKKKFGAASPDLTTNGIAKKRWMQNSDKTSFLLKAGSTETQQSPLGEVLVSVLAENLDAIPCVKYDLYVEGVTMCSKSDNFITVDTDLVPASHIYYHEPRNNDESVYDHLLRMCELFDIPDAEEYIRVMIFIDSISGNEDRNLNNIGFLRDMNTMKFIGPAPLFDSGNAYWGSKNVNNFVKSKFFGDITNSIAEECKKKYNIDFLAKDFGYKNLIWHYPYMSELKKENLIKAIEVRNSRICNLKRVDKEIGR